MGHRQRFAAWYIGAGIAFVLVVTILVPRRPVLPPEPQRDFQIAEPSAMRINANGKTERLPVYRIVANGIATHTGVCPPEVDLPPVLRVDFELDGRAVSIWIRDSSMTRARTDDQEQKKGDHE